MVVMVMAQHDAVAVTVVLIILCLGRCYATVNRALVVYETIMTLHSNGVAVVWLEDNGTSGYTAN